MTMAANCGGYDYVSVVDKDLDKFTCNICTKILRDPHLTGCCGQHFCESCLDYWFTKHRKESCPHCRAEGEEFTHILDKKLKREIDDLKIYCINKEEGCQWEGELGTLKDHLESDNGCDYIEVECPNKCEEATSTNVRQIKRKEISNHLQNECDLRPYKCEHCGYEDTYEAIAGGTGTYYSSIDLCHYNKCPEFPLECPNKCGVKDIKRKDMEDHRSQCPEEELECPNKCYVNWFIKRKIWENHTKQECELRQYKCEHCGLEDAYHTFSTHYSTCPGFPLECPNKCGVKDIKRKDMEDHRSQCPEEEVECPNGCESQDSNPQEGQAARVYYKQKDLAKHLDEECELRPYQCGHCGLKDTYYCISIHYTTCPEFPMKCPNSCGVIDIKRKDMEDHRSECPEEPVHCPFVEVGCDTDLLRCELEQHMSTNQQQHLLLVMGAYKGLKHKLQQVKQDNMQMKKELQQIKQQIETKDHMYESVDT